MANASSLVTYEVAGALIGVLPLLAAPRPNGRNLRALQKPSLRPCRVSFRTNRSGTISRGSLRPQKSMHSLASRLGLTMLTRGSIVTSEQAIDSPLCRSFFENFVEFYVEKFIRLPYLQNVTHNKKQNMRRNSYKSQSQT